MLVGTEEKAIVFRAAGEEDVGNPEGGGGKANGDGGVCTAVGIVAGVEGDGDTLGRHREETMREVQAAEHGAVGATHSSYIPTDT